MALIAAGMSPSQFSTPSVFYQPRPSYPPPSSRYTPPAPRPSPTAAGPSDWSRLSAFTNSEAGQQHLASQQPQPEQGGFWGSPFGKGLGYVINNPVTRVATAPLNYLQTGGRAVTLGIEELAEATEGVPDWMKLVSPLGLMTAAVDTERTEADKRSNWEKLLDPHTSYGYGELLDPDNNKWVNRIAGLAGDVITDPLTYVGPGALRAVTGASHVDEAARGLKEASEFLRVAEEAGDAEKIAKGVESVAQYEDYVRRAPEMGNLPTVNVPLPRNRVERANLFGELSETDVGRRLMEEFPGEMEKGGIRGFQTMSPEAKELLGISKPGLRVRGGGPRIPLTGPIGELINWGGGWTRQGLANLPGGESAWRNIRTPEGLEDEFATLTRGGGGDMMRAASNVQARNVARVPTGAMLARGNRIMSQGIKDNLRGLSDAAARKLRVEAETLPEPNALNKMLSKMLGVYQEITGREINPEHLLNPDTYLPHLMDPGWRRTLAKMDRGKNKAVDDFLRITDTKADELLEDPAFYADNLMEGSGFLEKSRKFGLDKDGNPQTFTIGGKEITFEANDLDHINEKLHEAFPNYQGDFYDTNPQRILEAYNKSLSRQAGRDVASRRMIDVGNPLAFELGGPVDEARLAMNKALAEQHAAPLLSTAQGKYDPTKALPTIPEAPLVPGASTQPQVQKLEAAARAASSPEEAAALTAEAGAIPARVPTPGGVKAEDYFVTTEGELATKARDAAVTRSKTYARAAAADSRTSMEKLRDKVAELKEIIISPLKSSIKDMDGEIKTLKAKIKVWGKTVTDMGELNPENLDEMTVLVTNVEDVARNAELKLKRTATSWRGRATRVQRSTEKRLRTELQNLKSVRDAAYARIEAAPKAMRDELEARMKYLNQDMWDAQEAVFRAERSVPVPHVQGAADEAWAHLEDKLVEGDDPGMLLERYRKSIRESETIDVAHGIASAIEDTPEIAAERAKYVTTLQELRDLGGKRQKNGKLSKANQLKWDKANVELKRLEAVLAGAPPRFSPYEESINRLGELDEIIPHARPADLRRLISERNRIQRWFNPGGKFYEESQARSIMRDLADYNRRVEAATVNERAILDRVTKERARRQESIIWASPGEGEVRHGAVERVRQGRRIVEVPVDKPRMRYMTAYGEDPSELEGMGWGIGQVRHPEAVIETPMGVQGVQGSSPATIHDPAAFKMPGGELAGVPAPRTEQEALRSLQSRLETGGAGAMEARSQAIKATERAAEAEATLPERLAEEQALAASVVKGDADRALGPLAERAETYRNLATDLSDRRNLVAKREETRALRDRIKANPTNQRTDLGRVLDDLEAVAKENPLLDDPKLNQVESLLHTHREELQRIETTRMRVRDLDRVAEDAANGRLGKVMIATLNNNWRALHSGPLNTGDIIMDAELHARFTNLFELNRQPKMLGRTFNAFTNLFKTYATLTPGFFVRNTIGGVFMNTADGVTLRAQEEGARLWQQFMKGGEEWLAEQPRRVKDAFAATMASGAGGRFEDAGVLAKTSNKLYNLASSNRVTRLGQRWGTRVEGGMRLGMALHSVDNGMGVQGALQRITRVHFDYSQVSKLDETMKRIIPFWTFMSRNLPLQIQEQWTNPRVYSYYDHLIQNFSEPDAEFTPDYWTRQGAWRTPVSIGGAPLYLQPDLGFTRVQGDVQALGGALGGDNPGLLFSQANPMIGATLDFFNKRDSFYNRAYGPEDYKKMSGLVGAPMTLIAKMFGQTNEAGQVSENFANYMQSLAPPLNQVQRLFPGATGEDSTAQTWVKRARYGGAPIQLLTPEAQDSEYWRQWRAMQDEQDRLEAMAKEAAS